VKISNHMGIVDIKAILIGI